ncbi:hypothetical protein [Leeia aquatica]|uniref:Uncharacterized protein n=1 Tax=Leeia aquatica TaxID=2725557 RepID=A0A847S4C7_9NEIS|nr:hypothetical protein [Leeia aquatica]NLR74624.1 hypothetical protein [Leeia aquatica]
MKRISFLLGAVAGILFALWNALVSWADTAELDAHVGLTSLSWPALSLTAAVYAILGGGAALLVTLLLRQLRSRWVKRKQTKPSDPY